MTATLDTIGDGAGDLIARAVAGDENAFARIVAAHQRDLVRICYVICGDQDIAEEAVAAAWPIAWRKLGMLRESERLRPWLASVAANEARQLLRRRHRRTVVELSVKPAGPIERDHDPATRAADLDLANALARLDPEDRALLALRYVAGFDSFEIARLTGRSASGTRARLARLLERLRKDLGDD